MTFDILNNQIKLHTSEASDLIAQLSREDQRRVLAALHSFVETTK